MTPASPDQDEESGSFAAQAARLYGVDLLWFLLGRLKNEQDARDVSQEIYLRLLRLGRGELVREPRAYVYFVARQVLAQFRLRARQSPVTYDSDLAGQREPQPEELVRDGVADRLMALSEAEQALAALPPVHARVFALRTFEGLSWAQIAERLEISVHTVKKYLCEANARISTMQRAI
jgi:RNA polymerase sigma factor (sigma-70 family)